MTERPCAELTRQAQVFENKDILMKLKEEMKKLAAINITRQEEQLSNRLKSDE